jgi:integrase
LRFRGLCRSSGSRPIDPSRWASIVAKVEKVRAGVLTPSEMTAAGHLHTPIEKHTKAYLRALALKAVRGRPVAPRHVYGVGAGLERVIRECRFLRLKDIDRQEVQRWMEKQAQIPRDPERPDSPPISARTINTYRSAIVAFCNWCVDERRLTANPLAGLSKAPVIEPVRKRRALTEDEIARLLKATKERPLREALTIRRGRNKGKLWAKVRPEVQEHLRRVGEERALIYRFLLTTGLRKGEVTTLPTAALDLDANTPCVHIQGKHAKSGKSATLPLRTDLAEDLRKHLAQRNGSELLFDVPVNFNNVYDADLRAAGIPKTDAHGRTLDIHCLRHTFATLLARNGVSPAVAQKLLRHSDIRLTMNIYTHPDLADTADAVAALPAA